MNCSIEELAALAVRALKKAGASKAMAQATADALVAADSYFTRLEVMISKMLADDGVRLPGARRQQAAAKARADGIEITDTLLSELRQLARGGRRPA